MIKNNMNEIVLDKLNILADSAKYDVSCASSGITKKNNGKGLGNTVNGGICHSYTEDGRCISLLKLLMTNHCIYDCAYCINRKSNDIKRTTMAVQEVVDLTINFYRRNYIEGLFLSSGVIKNPDYTMERLALIAKKLRTEEKFFGYIHLKAIPGASESIIRLAGLYADRLSVNIEIPSEQNLKILAPDKNYKDVYTPMTMIRNGILQCKEDSAKYRKTPKFSPAGQSTQLIIGATPDSDKQIMYLASGLYKTQNLKRVYYSGFLPVNQYDSRLPVLSAPPLKRENRLYQTDWLLRFYSFSIEEILNDDHPNLDLEIDPKLSYALRNPQHFPVDINRADYEMILRIPGVGVKSAMMIINARKHGRLGMHHLKKIGVVLKRAKYFITTNELGAAQTFYPEIIRRKILTDLNPNRIKDADQLKLFNDGLPNQISNLQSVK